MKDHLRVFYGEKDQDSKDGFINKHDFAEFLSGQSLENRKRNLSNLLIDFVIKKLTISDSDKLMIIDTLNQMDFGKLRGSDLLNNWEANEPPLDLIEEAQLLINMKLPVSAAGSIAVDQLRMILVKPEYGGQRLFNAFMGALAAVEKNDPEYSLDLVEVKLSNIAQLVANFGIENTPSRITIPKWWTILRLVAAISDESKQAIMAGLVQYFRTRQES